MNTFARWIIGLLTIVFFPLTIILLAFYAIFYKIPVFVGIVVEDIIHEIKEKWFTR